MFKPSWYHRTPSGSLRLEAAGSSSDQSFDPSGSGTRVREATRQTHHLSEQSAEVMLEEVREEFPYPTPRVLVAGVVGQRDARQVYQDCEACQNIPIYLE